MISQLITASNLVPVIAIIVFIIAAITIFLRTGSGHLLRVRMWRTLSGKAEVDDPLIQQYIADATSLQAYQYYSRINAGTLRDAQQLISFSKQRNIPTSLIQRAGGYFNTASCELNESRIPGKMMQIFVAITYLLFTLIIAFSFAFFTAAGPVYKMRESGTRFILTSESAQTIPDFWLTRKGLTASDCANNQTERSSFTASELAVICQALKDPEQTRDLHQDLVKQRWFLAWIIAFSLYVIAILLLHARKIGAVRTLRTLLTRVEPS